MTPSPGTMLRKAATIFARRARTVASTSIAFISFNLVRNGLLSPFAGSQDRNHRIGPADSNKLELTGEGASIRNRQSRDETVGEPLREKAGDPPRHVIA